jgi:hypothetical protein
VIRHTVAFRLKHPSGSAAEAAFLRAARVLTAIPTVQSFEWLQQVGKMSNFAFGFSMAFASQQDYDGYNVHPEHIRFVETHWKRDVAEFLELDYVPFVPE